MVLSCNSKFWELSEVLLSKININYNRYKYAAFMLGNPDIANCVVEKSVVENSLKKCDLVTFLSNKGYVLPLFCLWKCTM